MFLRMQTWTRTGMVRDRSLTGESSRLSDLQKIKSAKPHTVETEELVNLRLAVLRKEKEKTQEHGRKEFIASLLHINTSAEQAKQMMNEDLPAKRLSRAETKLVRLSATHELAALNAAVAAVVMMSHDAPEARNYKKTTLSTAVIKRVLPDLIQDFRNLIIGHKFGKIKNIMSNLSIICHALQELSDFAAKEDTSALNDAAFHYLCPAVRLFVSVLSIDEGTKALVRAHKIKEMTQDLCKQSSKFALYLYTNSPGSSSVDLHENMRRLNLTAQALTTAVQLTAPTLFAPKCQTAIFEAVTTILVAVEKLDERQWNMRRLEQRERKEAFDLAAHELLMMVQSVEEEQIPNTKGLE